MKLRNSFLMIAGMLLSQQAMSACVLDTDPITGGGQPATLTIPGEIIYVDAGDGKDTNVGKTLSSTSLTHKISYINCVVGEKYGKAALSLSDEGNHLYATYIKGLSVRPMFNNNVADGYFPSESSMVPQEGESDKLRMNYEQGYHYKLQFVKTEPRLQLKNPAGDVVLPANSKVLVNWISDTSKHVLTLSMGEIRIISIPSCTIDGPKTVDFGTVTKTDLTNSVIKDLNFNLTCATDYGKYGAKAYLTAASVNGDGSIQVKDHANNSDRMKIMVSDSQGKDLPANAELSFENQNNISSDSPAEFKWHATLTKVNDALPEDGKFTAQAEILLVVN